MDLQLIIVLFGAIVSGIVLFHEDGWTKMESYQLLVCFGFLSSALFAVIYEWLFYVNWIFVERPSWFIASMFFGFPTSVMLLYYYNQRSLK